MRRRIRALVASGEWASYAYAAIVAITGFEVAMRYLFNAPTIWVHELSIMLGSCAFLVGGVYVLKNQEHIRISFVYDALPRRGRAFLDRLANLVSALYLGLLAYSAYKIMTMAWLFGERSGSAWNSPMPIVLKTALFLCSFSMALICLYRAFRGHRTPEGSGQ